jgi:cell division protein FtsI/penicillin-binding protein 2
MAMSVIASGGLLLRPQVIRRITDASGETVYRYDRVVKQQVITPETARTMARLLQGVVSAEGTAPGAAIPNYEVAGKTGTTQKILRVPLPNGGSKAVYSERHHVVSFVGFLPASRPQVVISVIVDDADARCPGGIAAGASVAAPSFKHLAEQLIPYLDIKPVYESSGRNILALEGVRR